MRYFDIASAADVSVYLIAAAVVVGFAIIYTARLLSKNL